MNLINNFNILIIFPEIILLSLIAFLLIVDLLVGEKRSVLTYYFSLVILLIVLLAQIYIGNHCTNNFQAFNGMIINDAIANFTKIIFYIVVFIILIYTKNYNQNRQIFNGEFYLIILFALLGMDLMVSANHLLILYLGLELMSLSLYSVIALRKKDYFSNEAALKYFVLGSLASGFLLYGISLLYGATGTLYIEKILSLSTQENFNKYLVAFACIFILVGISFKFGVAPFHMWLPDVYQGSTLSITMFIASIPKLAILVFAYRVLISGLAVDFLNWSKMLQILAVLSLFIGNFTAIIQTNIKRMLGFSTISNMGFVMLALSVSANKLVLSSTEINYSGIYSAYYYIIAYIIMSLATFGILIYVSNEHKDCENITDLAGLNQKNSWYALIMLLAMFSMAGIPPLMGFNAKLYVIISLLKQNYIFLPIYAVIMSLIGAFYYLRVVKVMYFDDPQFDNKLDTYSITLVGKILLSINGILLLIFGIFPDYILRMVNNFF